MSEHLLKMYTEPPVPEDEVPPEEHRPYDPSDDDARAVLSWGYPDYEEPGPYDFGYWSDQAAKQLHGLEQIDGAEPIDMFGTVTWTETDDELRFDAPRRLLDAGRYGRWVLHIYGKRRWFKEHDNYGEIRYTADERGNANGAIWLPHLYPFEDTDDDNMPRILDRERCDVEICLQKAGESGINPYPCEVTIQTDFANVAGSEDISAMNPFGDIFFNEFYLPGVKLVADTVEFQDDKVYFINEMMEDLRTRGHRDLAEKLRLGITNLTDVENARLDKYFAWHKARDWKTRQRLQVEDGNAFGRIFVPVDDLRKGIGASMVFPTFQK